MSLCSDKGAEYNIADMGFGVSQVLPIAAQLWALSVKKRRRFSGQSEAHAKIVIIEQPELHLHPALQGKLGDLFCALIRAADDVSLKLRLVIETHSETIINRIGSKVALGEIAPEQVGRRYSQASN